jgi:hypothetical protein
VEAARVTWPPPRPEEADVPQRPWDPGQPRARGLVGEYDRLVYVVVDEIVEGWVGLSVSLWPHADPEGRLRFVDPRDPVDVGTSCDALVRFLETGEHHDPEARGVRIGDTFTARVKRGTAAKLLDVLRDRAGHGEARIDDLGEFLERPVDLSDQGRQLAKLASFGAMLSTLPSHLEERWQLKKEEEE